MKKKNIYLTTIEIKKLNDKTLETFAERLTELRREKNLSQNDLAADIGFSQSAIARWERHQRLPDMQTLALLANYFDVSADYLLGLSDY